MQKPRGFEKVKKKRLDQNHLSLFQIFFSEYYNCSNCFVALGKINAKTMPIRTYMVHSYSRTYIYYLH